MEVDPAAAFAIFDKQDSGCLSYGVERRGRRLFVKTATTTNAHESLGRAIRFHEAVRHPAIVAPLEVIDAPPERIEMIDAVWRAVGELNPDLRMALLLRDVVGLSYAEIADSLEVTLATVKWRIYKAREEVQLALAREGMSHGRAVRPADAEL